MEKVLNYSLQREVCFSFSFFFFFFWTRTKKLWALCSKKWIEMPISFLCWAVWMSQGLSCSIHILHKRFPWLINLLLSGHGQGNVWVSFSMDSRAKGSWGWERNLLILFYVIFLLCVKGSEPETETRCCLCVPIKARLTKTRLLLTSVTHLPLGFILCKCVKIVQCTRESALFCPSIMWNIRTYFHRHHVNTFSIHLNNNSSCTHKQGLINCIFNL